MDNAVATCLVVCVEDVVCHSVVEQGVKEKPRQLVVGDGVVYCRVAAGDDSEDKGDEAVLAVATGVVE